MPSPYDTSAAKSKLLQMVQEHARAVMGERLKAKYAPKPPPAPVAAPAAPKDEDELDAEALESLAAQMSDENG